MASKIVIGRVTIMVDLSKYEQGEIFSPIQKDLVMILQKKGPLTRAEIVREIKAPRTTIYDNLMGLMAHNIIKKYSRPTNSKGRPPVFFKLQEGN
jgi:predicted ArsR family transcriptional regulator